MAPSSPAHLTTSPDRITSHHIRLRMITAQVSMDGMATPDDDPMPDHVLQRILSTLEPHREQVEPMLRAAVETEQER